MANSADPDQMLLQKTTDLDLHCLQMQVYPGSAGQGFTYTVHYKQSIQKSISVISPSNFIEY